MEYLNIPLSFRGNEVTVGIKRSEMRLRLDLHVAMFIAPRNDKWKIDFKSSVCAQSALHQADNLAKLRLDYLSVF